MHSDSQKISILVDNDSWITSHAQELADLLTDKGYSCNLAGSKEGLDGGWINFILGCVHILPGEYLQRYKHNLVVHESDLPQGKGFAPMTWQILEGKSVIPVCLVEASESVDSGGVWLRDTIELDGSELNADWRRLQGKKTTEICLRFVEQYDSLSPTNQFGGETFYPRRKPDDSKLEIDRTISEQFNLLRVTDNEEYPAFFYVGNQKYIVKIEKAND